MTHYNYNLMYNSIPEFEIGDIIDYFRNTVNRIESFVVASVNDISRSDELWTYCKQINAYCLETGKPIVFYLIRHSITDRYTLLIH